MNNEVIERSKRLEDLAKMLEKKADAFQVLPVREKYHQWIIDLRSLIISPLVEKASLNCKGCGKHYSFFWDDDEICKPVNVVCPCGVTTEYEA